MRTTTTMTCHLSPHLFTTCMPPLSASAQPTIPHCTEEGNASFRMWRGIGPPTSILNVSFSLFFNHALLPSTLSAGASLVLPKLTPIRGHPSPVEHSLLNRLLSAVSCAPATNSQSRDAKPVATHSLLQTTLDVPLPLHISLSRPLVLRTETKATFLTSLRDALTSLTSVYKDGISVSPTTVSWHGNEDGSRAFLVLRVRDNSIAPKPNVQDDTETTPQPDALSALLKVCNRVAGEFDQPLLYATHRNRDTGKREDISKVSDESDASSSFHISIAWALPTPSCPVQTLESLDVARAMPEVENIMEEVKELKVGIEEVKIRIGKDVTSLPFEVRQKHRYSHQNPRR